MLPSYEDVKMSDIRKLLFGGGTAAANIQQKQPRWVKEHWWSCDLWFAVLNAKGGNRRSREQITSLLEINHRNQPKAARTRCPDTAFVWLISTKRKVRLRELVINQSIGQFTIWPACWAWRKVKGSPKLLQFITREIWMSGSNVMAIHQIVTFHTKDSQPHKRQNP